jgi:molybdopterin-guanine dinucleotide biosynthesis protein B
MPANGQARACSMPLFGIAGWSNAGKTTLIEKLTQHFAERGLRVATIKHTHHKFDIDAPGSDTARHRAAGAAETAIVSGSRVAVIEEIESAGEPALVIAADYEVEAHGKLVFRLDDIAGIASMIEETCGPFKRLRQRA